MYRTLLVRLAGAHHRLGRLIGACLAAVILVTCGGAAGPRPTVASTSPIARPGGGSSSPLVVTTSAPSASPTASASVAAATASPTTAPTGPSPSGPSTTPSFWTEDVTARDDDHQGATYLPLTATDARWGALAIETGPNANCLVGGQYPSGARFSADPPIQKRADGSGGVRWSFSLTPAEHGSAFYEVTCSAGSSLRTVHVHFLIG